MVGLGEDTLLYLVLALGAAMVVGNLLALVRPPEKKHADEDLDQAPVVRSIVFAGLGLIAAGWAIATLIAS